MIISPIEIAEPQSMPLLLYLERSFFMSLRIVRPTCCGMDIHKDIIVATIGITDPATNITQYFMRQFGTRNHDLLDLADWLGSYHCKDVAMESTGKYWIPIHDR